MSIKKNIAMKLLDCPRRITWCIVFFLTSLSRMNESNALLNNVPWTTTFRSAPSLSPFLQRNLEAGAAAFHENNDNNPKNDKHSLQNVGVIILAGGTGSRMNANTPKQFLHLANKPILHHSLLLFLNILQFRFVVLVLDPLYQAEYQKSFIDVYGMDRIAFANPGKERQGSVENGLNRLIEITGESCKYVAVHDSARPLVTPEEVMSVVSDAREYGAAVLGVPCKATIKESEDGILVKRTIPRSRLWEVHTPQVIRVSTLLRGFKRMLTNNWDVTDDVSIVENMNESVKLTRGEYTNLKITTPEDMGVAEAILAERKSARKIIATS